MRGSRDDDGNHRREDCADDQEQNIGEFYRRYNDFGSFDRYGGYSGLIVSLQSTYRVIYLGYRIHNPLSLLVIKNGL